MVPVCQMSRYLLFVFSHIKKMYGEDLPLTQCGFLSVTEMVGALSDTFYVQPSTEEGAKHLLIMELKPNEQPGATPYCIFNLSGLATSYLS